MTPGDLTTDGGAIDLEKKRGMSPWVIFGIVLFVVGIVFGVRRATAKKTPDVADVLGAFGLGPA